MPDLSFNCTNKSNVLLKVSIAFCKSLQGISVFPHTPQGKAKPDQRIYSKASIRNGSSNFMGALVVSLRLLIRSNHSVTVSQSKKTGKLCITIVAAQLLGREIKFDSIIKLGGCPFFLCPLECFFKFLHFIQKPSSPCLRLAGTSLLTTCNLLDSLYEKI